MLLSSSLSLSIFLIQMAMHFHIEFNERAASSILYWEGCCAVRFDSRNHLLNHDKDATNNFANGPGAGLSVYRGTSSLCTCGWPDGWFVGWSVGLEADEVVLTGKIVKRARNRSIIGWSEWKVRSGWCDFLEIGWKWSSLWVVKCIWVNFTLMNWILNSDY